MNRHLLQPITEDHVRDYARDGAVCIRRLLDDEWVARMRAAANRVIADPAAHGKLSVSQGETMTSVCYMWRQDRDFRDLLFESPAAEAVGRVIGSREIRIYHDHLFHKRPKSPKVMQWHMDATAWPVSGYMAPNIWIALTDVYAENGRIEFVAGYHRHCIDNKIEHGFKADQASGLCPDFERERSNPNFRFITWDLKAGDAVLFHPLTPHFSKGNESADAERIGLALRLLGDDVRWNPLSYKANIPGVPNLTPGEAPEGEFFPVLWRAPANEGRLAS